MCSVQEGDVDAPIKKTDQSENKDRLCMKCRQNKAILITRVNDAFCRECFMVYVTHKFRAAIGKSKLIRDGENVLVAYSGGQSSGCMLHLIKEGLSERAHKKLRFKPSLLFIDEGAVMGMAAQERFEICSKVLKTMEATGYPCYIKALEQAVELDKEFVLSSHSQNGLENGLPTDEEISKSDTSEMEDLQTRFRKFDLAESKLTSLLASLKSITAKEDLVKSLRQKLLIDLARERGFTKVMLADCSTRLAVRLLSDMAQGHGGHVAMDTAFADKRHSEITIVRPIRDFSSKEVALYNILNNVDTIFIPTLTTKASDGTSIEHLTEKFVTGLQADYPSTTSNIMRTGEKLSTQNPDTDDQHCAICQAPLDTDVGLSSALSAVEFSQKLSRQVEEGGRPCTQESTCCGEGDGSCKTGQDSGPSREDVMVALCYGCRLMIRELSDIQRLPPHILRDISYRSRRRKMKSDISQFLLNEDGDS
ncbi:hypothetical protein FSP39_001545 [Pinctada imbricata]|uniref:Cytoplasmic tRNA 2-thiolation protein 2 n=1 Tax=Pinctada imbricata TaxID=66713 RepID=A0AA88XHL7_PINIB|nr:hypothetical protein FSP39_001545 [Pinctada imbricata]